MIASPQGTRAHLLKCNQTSQTSSRKTAKNQADTLKTNDGQSPSSLEDKVSKEQLYQKDHPNSSKGNIIVKETERKPYTRAPWKSSDAKASQSQSSNTKNSTIFNEKGKNT